MLRKSSVLLLIFFTLAIAAFADGGKVESTGAFTGAGTSESVKASLEDKGYRVTLADGAVLCDIWLRKALPTEAKKDVPGATYTEIVDSSVVGVISFPKTSQDFRGQDIKAGAYTIRYALHPTDGNHMGISPFRDFLLLTPIADDQNADARYKFEELVKMSAKTTNSNHPAALSLVAAEGGQFPSVKENEHEHLVFSAKVKTSAGTELPLSFVVKGVAEQ